MDTVLLVKYLEPILFTSVFRRSGIRWADCRSRYPGRRTVSCKTNSNYAIVIASKRGTFRPRHRQKFLNLRDNCRNFTSVQSVQLLDTTDQSVHKSLITQYLIFFFLFSPSQYFLILSRCNSGKTQKFVWEMDQCRPRDIFVWSHKVQLSPETRKNYINFNNEQKLLVDFIKWSKKRASLIKFSVSSRHDSPRRSSTFLNTASYDGAHSFPSKK